MADSRSIIVDTTTQNGIKKQKSFTDIDPEATAVEMLNFANAAVALTTDTFRAASYVDKEYLAGGSITKEQLITNTGQYSETKNYPSGTGTSVAFTIRHATNTALTVAEHCALNITVKTYETDVYVSYVITSYNSSSSSSDGGVQIYIRQGESSPSSFTFWGLNQGTTQTQPIDTTKGAGRIEITIHDGATYKGFTYTININAKA